MIGGCNLPKDERDAFASTSETNRHAVRFLENIVIDCERKHTPFYDALKRTDKSGPADTNDLLPTLNEDNLFRAFSQYDINGSLSIDSKELYKWMKFMHGK